MRFSKGRTYNSHDTKLEKTSTGRIGINQEKGVKLRCELSLNAVLRFGPKGVNDEMVTSHLNKRLGANYLTTDIRYALDRLVAEGIISATGGRKDRVYKAGKAALDHWRKLPKK